MPESVHVKLGCTDLDEFVALFATNISRGGIFLQSRSSHIVDEELYFCLRLANDNIALEGRGRVIWVRPFDEQDADQPFGVGLRFTDLDETNQALVDRVVASKNAARKGRRQKRNKKFSPTQEVHALARQAVVIKQADPAPSDAPIDKAVAEVSGADEAIFVEAQSPIAIAQRILNENCDRSDYDKQSSETDLLEAVLATTGDVAAVDEMLERMVAESGLTDARIAEVIANAIATPELVPEELSELSSPAVTTNQELVDALTSLAEVEASKVAALPQAPPEDASEKPPNLDPDADVDAEEGTTTQWLPGGDGEHDDREELSEDSETSAALRALLHSVDHHSDPLTGRVPEEAATEPLVSGHETLDAPAPKAIPVPLDTGREEDSLGGPTLPGLPAPASTLPPTMPALPVDEAPLTEEVDLGEIETIEDSGLLELDDATDPSVNVTDTTAIGAAPTFESSNRRGDPTPGRPPPALDSPLPASPAAQALSTASNGVDDAAPKDNAPIKKKKSGFFRRIFSGKDADADEE